MVLLEKFCSMGDTNKNIFLHTPEMIYVVFLINIKKIIKVWIKSCQRNDVYLVVELTLWKCNHLILKIV